ncbi:hypothetical protein RJ639_028858 [Escallonia herrerae]|uniref:DRBM domain-containing protein n=1 Tax=Escallonia herrerae TaxID=1293975 RepID=A0AA88X3R5_9ASTE|nr:hypothetical protein RJ639_028858 [Escallonia herrerae]
MYKNQLQELAQRSCFNLPSYACIRGGPDHSPRFKASVNFNGEIFDSPSYCTTLRQAEHAAAEVALNVLSTRGPSRSLTARVLDETGVYKNLLQETAHRAGLKLPVYTTVRSGPGHVPVFTCTVELAGMNFIGEPAKTKKQAEKNAAIAAWSSLKRIPNLGSLPRTSKKVDNTEEQEHINVARVLSNYGRKVETKLPVRRTYQSQAGRRILGIDRDIASSSSVQYQQMKLMDLLLDSATEGLTQKQNSFVSLLPPPPPRTTSKILPLPSSSLHPSTTRPAPVQVVSKLQFAMQEVPAPLNEHQRDEDEWLYGKSKVKMPIENEGPRNLISSIDYGANYMYRHFAVPNTGKQNTAIADHTISNEKAPVRTRLPGLPTPSQMAIHSNNVATKCSPVGRTTYTGGYHPQCIAPAVQIRSVVPVCAAPPPPSRTPLPSNSSPSSMKEAALPPSAASMSKHATGAEVLQASPKSNRLQSYSSQLKSMFNTKLQL